MTVSETKLQGCFIIQPRVFEDDRGFFYERFNKKRFEDAIGQHVDFVQDNLSKSSFGVLRGLHFQKDDYSQAKLVSVLKGRVLDVAVDLRTHSKTFGQSFAMELSEDNKTQLYIPKGFAHGFSVLSETAEFFYKCDTYYNKKSETGIIYNDETLNIDWKLNQKDIIINEKDTHLPNFKDAYYF